MTKFFLAALKTNSDLVQRVPRWLIFSIVACTMVGCASLPHQTEEDYEASPALLSPQNEFTVYGTNSGPLSWRAPTSISKIDGPIEIRDVEAEACQKDIFLPIGSGPGASYSSFSGLRLDVGWPSIKWQDGGFGQAVSAIERDNQGLIGLTDIKVDIRLFRLLVFQRHCLVVTAKALVRRSGASTPVADHHPSRQ